jgi:hypothetical protein
VEASLKGNAAVISDEYDTNPREAKTPSNQVLVPEVNSKGSKPAFAVRAIGLWGQDLLCATVLAAGPAQALELVLASNLLARENTRCWVVTALTEK